MFRARVVSARVLLVGALQCRIHVLLLLLVVLLLLLLMGVQRGMRRG
jgi:hypothetical protein